MGNSLSTLLRPVMKHIEMGPYTTREQVEEAKENRIEFSHLLKVCTASPGVRSARAVSDGLGGGSVCFAFVCVCRWQRYPHWASTRCKRDLRTLPKAPSSISKCRQPAEEGSPHTLHHWCMHWLALGSPRTS